MGTPARDRKRRQRMRVRAAGLVRLEVDLPVAVLEPLARLLAPFNGDLRHELGTILRIEIERHVERLSNIIRRAGPLYLAAERLKPFAKHLEAPGVTFRVHDRVYSSDEWHKVQNDLAALCNGLAKLGWPEKRINRFLKYAGTIATQRTKTV